MQEVVCINPVDGSTEAFS